MIVPKHYENLQVLHENTMPNRCYYIPASKKMDNSAEHRKDSDRFLLLSGKWKFCYYESIYNLQVKFYEENFDLSGFEQTEVPGVWQCCGYDSHQYTNMRYPIPFDPPYVPHDNPCGTYVYDFEYKISEGAPNAYLVFEGVDSCFFVWINGIYIGYSQVSHSTSEFDVTDALKEGKNRIAVLVLKWCDGTYLEDQDKFRMSGIFNDVYLLNRPKECIYDYFITTSYTEAAATVNIDITYLGNVTPTKVSLYNAQGVELEEKYVNFDTAETGKGSIHFHIPDAVLWNPENPYLYTVAFETNKEVITDRIGIRKIYIEDKTLYINGKPIIFRGVNRHDSDPVTGGAISVDQMKKDLELMKLHNFNAIRSSHYPNAPYFYQLCDQYGFFVIEEADNESHGASEIYFENDDFYSNKSKLWNEFIADNPDFIEAVLDRVKRCVEREKNRPCVVIWSMGNESSYGCAFEEALKWTKKYDPTRLTHYESAKYHSDKRKYDFSNLDLYSSMYPSLEEIDTYLKNDPKRPFLLVEYCHSMGNGPGDLEDYFQKFHKEKMMCGGFVWEWCDHGIYKGNTKDGKAMYFYGGDHGEEVHDGNFCMDGLVYPDRTPHTGLEEYKNVYRPVRVLDFDQDKKTVVFHNYLDYTNTKEYIQFTYEINCDGAVMEKGVLSPLSIEPHESKTAEIPFEIPENGNAYLKIYYYSAKPAALVPAGHLLGFEEISLKNEDSRNQTVVMETEKFGKENGEIIIEDAEPFLFVKGSQFSYCLDKRTGLFSCLEYGGENRLKRPMEINIWRAPTDNDRYIKAEWLRARYDKTYTRAYSILTERNGNMVSVRCRMCLTADAVQKIVDIDAEWVIDAKGAIKLSMKAVRFPQFPVFPRFGLRLFLDSKMESVEYYGMGPGESYCDKHQSTSHDIYCTNVADLHEDYINPQENGSHFDCSYVKIEGGGFGIAALSPDKISFNASFYTQEELTEKQHNFELQPSGSVVLCLDYAQNGIGSNSCGPRLLDKYRFDEKEFEFNIMLKPYL